MINLAQDVIFAIAILAFIIMWPTAIASWFSHCYRIPLTYGFVIVFSSVLLAILTSILPTHIGEMIIGVYVFAMACIIIYGVYRQFQGQCNLSYK